MSSVLGYLANFIVGSVALTVALYMLSVVVPRAGFVARVLASYLALLSVTFFGFFATVVIALAGYQGLSQWFVGRLFQFIMRWAVGVDFVIEDPNNVLATTRPAIFIGNHQTELDVLMLGCMFPKYCSITAKSALKHMPFLGWWMRISGSIFIDRKNSRDAREAMQGAANEIRAKRQSVYMFPEGTRSYAKDPMLLPFKKGAFHLAIQAGAPIVPVVVANYSNVLYPKTMHFVPGKIPVKGGFFLLALLRGLPATVVASLSKPSYSCDR
jgi:lysophosphatidate acyltransferase